MLTAFLLMVSSCLTLMNTDDRTPVYVNVAAMICLTVIITLINLKKSKD